MFIFGAFSPRTASNINSSQNKQIQLNSWINRINDKAATTIGYSNNQFLAGFCEDMGSTGKLWFLSENPSVDSSQIYVQAHGHPRGLAILSQLATKFGTYSQSCESIKSALRAIDTEYLCIIYVANKNIIYLVTDKIGVVPAYILHHNGYIYYSTALWILKLLDHFNDNFDWQGIAEKLYFRSPLGSRTIYQSVTRITGGTIYLHSEETSLSSYYKLWDSYRTLAPDSIPRLLASGFETAVSDRITNNQREYSTLSGGLDSRVVVTSLVKHAKEVVTFNFAAADSLDSKLSAMYSKHIGTEHYDEPTFALYYPNFSMLSRTFLNKLPGQTNNSPQAVWTGDDGSISIGLVYLRRNLLNQINTLDAEQVSNFLCNAARVLPPRMFKRNCFDELRRLAVEGASQFLIGLGDLDHSAKYYCFLMLNRVARMFDEHYETAHLHRIFRCMPFLDTRTIEPVLSADLPAASEHRLYFDFSREVSKQILAIPWQAYPGHEPCPLPLPEGKNQWEAKGQREFQYLRESSRKKMIKVMNSGLWRNHVRREMLAAYVLRDWLGVAPTDGIANALSDILDEHLFSGILPI